MSEAGMTSVLIIDGDSVRRGMLACTLPASRYTLEFASSAERGLDLLARTQPRVVVVGCGGVQPDLCQRIRSLPAGNACLLVLMDERYRDEAVGQSETENAGADAFLPFPFQPAELERQLRGRERPAAAQAASAPGGQREAPPARTADDPRGGGAPAAAEPWTRFRERVAAMHARLDTMDYYELLQISVDAPAAAIKDAFFSAAVEFHPDRYLRHPDAELKARVYDLFKRMSEAFKVLGNPEARSRYDANLAGPARSQSLRYLERDPAAAAPRTPVAEARTAAGQKYLHHAILAESEGRFRSVRMYLAMALQYEPDNEALQARMERALRRLS